MDTQTAGTKRLERGTLSRDLIVRAALDILDAKGATGLTFNHLGKWLGASPTAVYRYFSSRNELLLAVADELIGISLEGYSPSPSWLDSLRDLAVRAWTTFEKHPAAAVESYHVLTRGPHEMRAVDALLEALWAGGLRGQSAVAEYHLISSAILAMSGRHAAMMAQRKELGLDPDSQWVQQYVPADPNDFPRLAALRNQLEATDPLHTYKLQIDALLDSIEARAKQAKLIPESDRNTHPADKTFP